MIPKEQWRVGLVGLALLVGAIALTSGRHQLARSVPPTPPAGIVEAIEAGDVERVRAILATEPAAANAVKMSRRRRGRNFVVETALTLAARGKPEIVARLLDAGADPNRATEDGHVPLHAAAEMATEESGAAVAKLLLARGARADAASVGGWTPLHEATSRGSLFTASKAELMKVLLAAGARPDFADSRGYTPLHFAARTHDSGAVDLLLAAGARTDVRFGAENEDGPPDHLVAGDTPLHAAARRGVVEGALSLCRAGADPFARNDAGETPHDAALARAVQVRDSGHEWSVTTARKLVEALAPGGACAAVRTR